MCLPIQRSWRRFWHELKSCTKRCVPFAGSSNRCLKIGLQRRQIHLESVKEVEQGHQVMVFHRRAGAPRVSSSICLSRPPTRLLPRVLYLRGLKFNTTPVMMFGAGE